MIQFDSLPPLLRTPWQHYSRSTDEIDMIVPALVEKPGRIMHSMLIGTFPTARQERAFPVPLENLISSIVDIRESRKVKKPSDGPFIQSDKTTERTVEVLP